MNISEKQSIWERVKSNATGLLMATCCILMVFGSVPNVDVSFLSGSNGKTLVLQGYGNVAKADDLPDSDGDEIADNNDICPDDANNDCAEAQACRKLKRGWDKARSGSNWMSWVAGIFTVLTGLAALIFPGVGLAAYFGIHAAVNAIVALGINVAASDWEKQYKASGCENFLGWQ